MAGLFIFREDDGRWFSAFDLGLEESGDGNLTASISSRRTSPERSRLSLRWDERLFTSLTCRVTLSGRRGMVIVLADDILGDLGGEGRAFEVVIQDWESLRLLGGLSLAMVLVSGVSGKAFEKDVELSFLDVLSLIFAWLDQRMDIWSGTIETSVADTGE